MSIFEFNGHPFLLKADRISKSERQIYELLAQNDTLLCYPYEVEGPEGERATSWRSLSADDVRALLDETDRRPPVDRVSWDGTSDGFIRECGTPVTPRRIAPVAHMPFQCSVIDGHMTACTYALPLPVEDHVYLAGWVMENPDYDISMLRKTRPELYARITDSRRLPRELSPTSLVLLTSAERTACRLTDFEPYGDEAYAQEDKDGNMSHICVQVFKDHEIELQAETATDNDIEDGGLLAITDGEKFCRRTGAYTAESILRAIGTMYHGLDADLRHIAGYCDREKIGYILKG